ncbi:MAG: twin-arginine translocase subunit TatB [Sphingomonadales bacterium]|nr:twin-arginine translocase subunit TatB [Sphingomonadales bacterium]
MFDIAFGEMLLIVVLAVVVVGPKDLPRLMRTLGGAFRKVKRAASSFQSSLDRLAVEEEMAEFARKTNERIMKETAVDELKDIKSDIEADLNREPPHKPDDKKGE